MPCRCTETQANGNEDDDDERNEWADVDEINGNLCVLPKCMHASLSLRRLVRVQQPHKLEEMVY